MALKDIFSRSKTDKLENMSATIHLDLQAAQRNLAELEAQRGDMAYAIASGEGGAEGKMVAYRAEVADARQLVADLQAAYAVSMARDQRLAEQNRLALKVSQVKAIEQHLLARTKDAIRLAAAIENAANAYADIIAANSKIERLIPAGTFVPSETGTIIPFHLFKSVVAEELFRVGHGERRCNGLTYNFAFPGAVVADMRKAANPAALDPLEKKFKQSAKWILSVLRGETSAKPLAVDENDLSDVLGAEQAAPVPEIPPLLANAHQVAADDIAVSVGEAAGDAINIAMPPQKVSMS
jgi:hypothetical protein